jgi:hypothetical protein
VKKKIASALVSVIAFKKPGPKWQLIGDPVERPKAVLMVAHEWQAGNLARIVPMRVQKKAQAS